MMDMVESATPPEPTLVTVETIFCDVERRNMTLLRYFDRFRHTLRSIAALHVPPAVRVIHVIYVSADKTEWIERLHGVVHHWNRVSAVETRVVLYGHPSNGYPHLTLGHPDVALGPNKQPLLRSQLFASSEVQPAPGETLVRMTLDDDDILLPWHLDVILSAAAAARTREPDTAIGLGLRHHLVAYVEPTGVRVEHVSLNRILHGNKAYVFPPGHHETGMQSSPWNIPELMTTNYREKYRDMGIELMILEDHRPGFVYMRRGDNLSGQQKSGFVTAVHEHVKCAHESEVLAVLGRHFEESESGNVSPRFGIDPPVYRVNVRRQGSTIRYSTNVKDALGEEVVLAYYLLDGSTPVQTTPYGHATEGRFHRAPERCRVKLFVKKSDGSRETKVSNYV